MTAAFGDLFGPAVRARGGRVVCALALVLPVPLFAALGLSLPLPATVERLAAKLVPFVDQGSVSLSGEGSIVLARGEAQKPALEIAAAHGNTEMLSAGPGSRSDRVTPRTIGGHGPTVARPDARTGDDAHGSGAATAGGGNERAPTTATATDTAATPATASTPPVTNPPTEEQAKPNEPTPTQVVETTVNTATGVVESATATAVEKTTQTAEETVGTATETASGVVGVPTKP